MQITDRSRTNPTSPPAKPVSSVIAPQPKIAHVITRVRGQRSPAKPENGIMIAITQYIAVSMKPIWILLSPVSCWMSGTRSPNSCRSDM